MRIRGLSFQNGIFFIGKKFVSCSYHKDGRLHSWLEPLHVRTLLRMFTHTLGAMPTIFKMCILLFISLIYIPKIFFPPTAWQGLPYYTIFYFAFGTHFIFPQQLRKYHGAEHKVFSDRGVITRLRLAQIRKAPITNRYCSTNAVVIYFMSVIILTALLLLFYPIQTAIAVASYSSIVMIPLITVAMTKRPFHFLKKVVLKVSYFFQTYVTTKEPERMHLIAAIHAYRKLVGKEWPERLVARKTKERKEKNHMAIVDVTVIPIGTESTSVSEYVADIQTALTTYEDQITYKLTPMSTIIEGELSVLFEVIEKIHEIPFAHGVQRVATNIRIDDRRDQQGTMDAKVESVLTKQKEKEQAHENKDAQ